MLIGVDVYRSKLVNELETFIINFPYMHTEKPKPAFYHPAKATSEVNISLCGCEPGGEERTRSEIGRTIKTQSFGG